MNSYLIWDASGGFHATFYLEIRHKKEQFVFYVQLHFLRAHFIPTKKSFNSLVFYAYLCMFVYDGKEWVVVIQMS
jgi:hypothetical protein